MDRPAHDPDRSVAAADTSREEGKEKRETIRRARPVSGEIDHAELTREIIARFPKILAKLAE